MSRVNDDTLSELRDGECKRECERARAKVQVTFKLVICFCRLKRRRLGVRFENRIAPHSESLLRADFNVMRPPRFSERFFGSTVSHSIRECML